ncbi:MAG: hypothetical protein ACPKPY_07675 [Nitrososphaeraceae archaeon]
MIGTKKGGKESLYKLGFKRCSECDIYIKSSKIRCPCCKYLLRTKGREKVKPVLIKCRISN